MVKLGLIQASKFNSENYHELVRSSFKQVELLGNSYYKLFAFNQYIDGYDFDYVFNSEEELQAWLQDEQYPPLFKYFLIPVEIVPTIKQYAGFVNKSYPDLIFDYTLQQDEVEVEGETVTVPTSVIKMLPCNCTKWTSQGLAVLDKVIKEYNQVYPTKQIDFQVKFETWLEFKAFRDNYLNN